MVSEPLDAAALRRALAGRRFGTDLMVVAETGSTNADMQWAAAGGAMDGAVIVAEHQTAGRGRSGRAWESRPGLGVQLSALLVPGPPPEQAPLVSLAAGVATCEAISVAAPRVEARLKWPNDVMIDQSKVGGILVEGELRGGVFLHTIVGIGLNVAHEPEDLPEGATSLAAEAKGPVDRGRLIVALLVALEERLADLDRSHELLAAYRARSATIGRKVVVERRQGVAVGMALDVGPTGALLVGTDEGIEEVAWGDVIHVRMAGGPRGVAE